MTNDYSLLRPFDLEAAKRGDLLCWHNATGADYVARYIAGPDVKGLACVEVDSHLTIHPVEYFRMAPLCWVEGLPVYCGDVLYNKIGQGLTATGEDGGKLLASEFPDGTLFEPDLLTWTPPKVKREGWVNIYPPYHGWVAKTSGAHRTKEEADGYAEQARIACVRIEWEESP